MVRGPGVLRRSREHAPGLGCICCEAPSAGRPKAGWKFDPAAFAPMPAVAAAGADDDDGT